MRRGVAVLTNGGSGGCDLDRRGSFRGKLIDPIDVLDGNLRESARTLNEWLDRRKIG